MKRLLILKLGSTLPDLAAAHGDFEHWIARGLAVSSDRIAVVDGRSGESLPAAGELCGIVVTGSHAMVTDGEPWSHRAAAWLAGMVDEEVPLLGICFGHQLLAQALGGEVGFNPGGEEYGTIEVLLTDEAQDDPLLGGFAPGLMVQVCHAQSVLRLPPGARRLAQNAHDPHQAFVIGRSAWGVQFHPEFDARAMRAYIREAAAELEAAGRDPAEMLRRVAETPAAESLLARFGRLVLGGPGD